MTDLKQFKDQQFLSLETFRKNGEGVATPIWFAEEAGAFYMWTDGESGKIKRIRNNPKVSVAPCKRFGDVTGEWVTGYASVDESAIAVKHVQSLLRKKIGFGYAMFQFIDGIRDRSKGSKRVCLKVAFDQKG